MTGFDKSSTISNTNNGKKKRFSRREAGFRNLLLFHYWAGVNLSFSNFTFHR